MAPATLISSDCARTSWRCRVPILRCELALEGPLVQAARPSNLAACGSWIPFWPRCDRVVRPLKLRACPVPLRH